MHRFIVTVTLVVLMAMASTASAMGARQSGLVNINLENNVVQVPIAIAANVCGVTVAVLVQDLADGQAACTALSKSTAVATATPAERGGQTRQDGLINVNIEDNTVQVPIAAAANICDVSVLVLVQNFLGGATKCDAKAGAAGIA